jgi:hypothetical protein
MLALCLVRQEAATMERYGKTLTSAFDLKKSLQMFLTHLLLLLSWGLFSKGKLGPALIVLAIYVVTLIVNRTDGAFGQNDDQKSLTA